MPKEKLLCGWCNYDPVHKGAKCCAVHNLIVCSGCKGTDRYINAHKATHEDKGTDR